MLMMLSRGQEVNKIIIDKKSGGGVVPYLPLPELKKIQKVD